MNHLADGQNKTKRIGKKTFKSCKIEVQKGGAEHGMDREHQQGNRLY